ncbi:oligosaccharide flippase family protein [Methylorubrum aminovorans]
MERIMSQREALRRGTMTALFWSVVQNWGGRLISVVVLVALARLLRPEVFGLAALVFFFLTLIHLTAEFGLGVALVQRPDLSPADVNLPFYVALGISLLLAACLVLLSTELAGLIGRPEIAPYLAGAAAIAPFMTVNALQEAMYRREMNYRPLALRTLAGTWAGGAAGIGLAYLGFGVWALILQVAVNMILSAVWLWARPAWTPGRALRPRSAKELGRFGLNVVAEYYIDFATMRSIDFIIALKYGPAALGLYTVASRLYQLLIQLLQNSVSNVALALLSRIADDRVRVGQLFIRCVSLVAMTATPVFFVLAAVAPEINHIAFGDKWIGAEKLMTPLLLLGGFHCIQILSAPFLTAIGQPQVLMKLSSLKALLVLPLILCFPTSSVVALVILYAVALTLLTPLTLAAALRHLGMSWGDLVAPLGLPLLASVAGFVSAEVLRHAAPSPMGIEAVDAILYGLVFASIYGLAVLALAKRAARDNVVFLRTVVRR